jgi:hypothetical protein
MHPKWQVQTIPERKARPHTLFPIEHGYKTRDEFHSFLRGGLRIEHCSEVFAEEVTHCHSQKYRTCFSHVDLAPRKIIIQDNQIAGIVDWHFGGWYPEY